MLDGTWMVGEWEVGGRWMVVGWRWVVVGWEMDSWWVGGGWWVGGRWVVVGCMGGRTRTSQA